MLFRESLWCVLSNTDLPKLDPFNWYLTDLFGVRVAKTSNGRQFLTHLHIVQITILREYAKSRWGQDFHLV